MVSGAKAELIDNGDGTITQIRNDGSSLMWMQDTDYIKTSGYVSGGAFGDAFGTLGYSEAIAWVDNLEFAGYADWRLPDVNLPDSTCVEIYSDTWTNCTSSELSYLYDIEGIRGPNHSPFLNMYHPGFFWHASRDTGDGLDHDIVYSMNNGYIMLDYSENSTWAVRDISVVPEPISTTLFLIGGSFLIGRRYIKK